jgi:hypothetical protein
LVRFGFGFWLILGSGSVFGIISVFGLFWVRVRFLDYFGSRFGFWFVLGSGSVFGLFWFRNWNANNDVCFRHIRHK